MWVWFVPRRGRVSFSRTVRTMLKAWPGPSRQLRFIVVVVRMVSEVGSGVMVG